MSTNVNEQRDHEVSATYIETLDEWHALTRYNNNTYDGTSGFMHYISTDGNSWTQQGILSAIPESMGGIRHGVYNYRLNYAAPQGSNTNKYHKDPAFIVYQRIPEASNINEGGGSHQLRSRLRR